MKKKIIITSVFSLIITLTILQVYKLNYKEESLNNKKIINESPGMISLMIETKRGSGEYKESDSNVWPVNGYVYNEQLSNCENGSTLIWDEENGTLKVKTNKTDKCYAYFDVEPPNILVQVKNRPTTYGKTGTINCTGSTAVYNQQYNRIEISSFDKSKTDCELTYTDSTSKTNLATYIISLAGTTQGTGQVVNENGYRYEGKNPNNYIWFNNEYWRIIGVFDSASHGQSGKNLVKIIREESLGAIAWHKSNTSDWTAASLNKLLNGSYYNAEDGTDSGYCYGYSTTMTTNCNYTKKGIQASYRNMIANVTWYLGGYSSTSATTEAFYGYERGTTVYSGRPTSTTGYIGLMYPSDYGYSVLASSCARTTNIGSYNSSKCGGQSWLYGKNDEWTISQSSFNSSVVFDVGNSSNLGSNYANYGYSVLPVLYLDAQVYKITGDGSLENPYIIGM